MQLLGIIHTIRLTLTPIKEIVVGQHKYRDFVTKLWAIINK